MRAARTSALIRATRPNPSAEPGLYRQPDRGALGNVLDVACTGCLAGPLQRSCLLGQKLQPQDFWRSEARSQDGMLAAVLTASPVAESSAPATEMAEAHSGKSSSTTKSRRPWFESGITRARRRSYRVEKLALNIFECD